MEINKPLHGQVHLWIIFSIIISGYLAIILNTLYAKHHPTKKRETNILLTIILLIYAAGYSYLCFFYRTPMAEAHIRLEPFWSYREAFSGLNIERLSVARSSLLNILITIPLAMFLPVILRNTPHPYRNTLLICLALSILTELIQYLTRTGLTETDDIINNTLGSITGVLLVWLADRIIREPKQNA